MFLDLEGLHRVYIRVGSITFVILIYQLLTLFHGVINYTFLRDCYGHYGL